MPVDPTALAKLADPFAPGDIEWRVQQAGEKNGRPWARVLAYVTNRAIMERLDEVCGPANWRNTYAPGPAGGVVCTLAVHVARPDGLAEWVGKQDGAENTDVEPVKGGLSNAMKRAAVQWGIGRYLYDLDEAWARVHDGGKHSARTKDGTWFKWDPPELPEWATPKVPMMTTAQHEHLTGMLAHVADAKIVANVNKRIAVGLTEAQATDAIRYVEAHLPDRAAAASAPASRRRAA